MNEYFIYGHDVTTYLHSFGCSQNPLTEWQPVRQTAEMPQQHHFNASLYQFRYTGPT